MPRFRYKPLIHLACIAVVSVVLSCAGNRLSNGWAADPPVKTTPVDALLLRAVEDAELANLIQLTDRIWSGGEPGGQAAFERLTELRVGTVISVDSAVPAVALAENAGMKYVHIPTRYDGIDRSAQLMIFRAVREASGPVFFHCHHGKHRGPAAAAIGCIADGAVNSSTALQILDVAGTSRDYSGLWDSVRDFRLPEDKDPLPELSSSVDAEPMAQAMSRIDRLWSQVSEQTRANGQQDLLLLSEEFRELARGRLPHQDEDFRSLLTKMADLAALTRSELQSSHDIDGRLAAIRKSCVNCHAEWR